MENDRRTKRTKLLLKNAFTELLSMKTLNEISVKELCELADINRGTFYLHYQDIYDLKQNLENELYEQILNIANVAPRNIDEDTSYTFFLEMFRSVEKQKPLLKAFLGPNGDISFLRQIQTLFKEQYLSILLHGKEAKNLADLDYSYNFIASGFIGLVESWIYEETPTPAEEMAKLISKIVFDGLPSLVNFL